MKKTILIIVAYFLVATQLNAQTFEWAESFGGTDYDYSQSITTDVAGNVYTTGFFKGTVDFDPGSGVDNHTSVGESDIFIQKLDINGNFIWAKTFGGSSWDFSKSVTINANGNIYILGYFNNTVDFDPGSGTDNHTTAGASDVFIEKLDSNGNFIWVKTFGGSSNDVGNSITIDVFGNICSIGYFQNTVDFDPSGGGIDNHTSAGISDIFIQKLDTNGNFIWAKTFGGSTSDYGISIYTDINGNIYSTGYFWGTADFDPGNGVDNHTSAGYEDFFIQKLDVNGNFIWANIIGGSGYDEGSAITTDDYGNIYTTGYFNDTVDFDPGSGTDNHTTVGASDVFIEKLDSNGNFIWANIIGGSGYDEGSAITTDDYGNIYITGDYKDTVDFDPSSNIDVHSSVGGYDIYMQKLDVNGNFIWAKTFGSTIDDSGRSITIDADGNVYSTGYFQATTDFNPGNGMDNHTSAGGADIYIQKLSQCTLYSIDTQVACDSYTWIDGNTYTSNNNTATYTLTNSVGCDSVVTLDLTITHSTTGIDTQTACDSFTWIDGNTYTSNNNTATYTLTNSVGCDSVVTLDLTITTVNTDVIQNNDTLIAQAQGVAYQWLDCNDNYSQIQTANTMLFVPESSGDYAVKINDNGCIDTSNCYNVVVSNINNIDDNIIEIYPNPAKQFVNIVIPNSLSVNKITIYNITGVEVFTNKNNNKNYLINVSELKTGTYFIEIISTEKTITKKLIIK